MQPKRTCQNILYKKYAAPTWRKSQSCSANYKRKSKWLEKHKMLPNRKTRYCIQVFNVLRHTCRFNAIILLPFKTDKSNLNYIFFKVILFWKSKLESVENLHAVYLLFLLSKLISLLSPADCLLHSLGRRRGMASLQYVIIKLIGRAWVI